MRRIFALLLLILVFSSVSLAEGKDGRRGLITSSKCPFGCRDLKLNSDQCREWRSGDKCYVEDFTQPAGHQSMIRIRKSSYREWDRQTQKRMKMKRRGLVTSSSCPFTCKDAGVPEEFCLERQVGTSCEVEDLTQAPGHRSMMKVRPSSFKKWSKATEQAMGMKRRGLVTSTSCPYSCASTNIPNGLCREWQAGNTCYVEDLTQAPGHRSMFRMP